MKKTVIIFLAILTLSVQAADLYRYSRFGTSIQTGGYKAVDVSVGFASVSHLTESTIIVYGKYGYNFGEDAGSEAGGGLIFNRWEFIGLGVEAGVNSEGNAYFSPEFGYFPFDGFGITTVGRIDYCHKTKKKFVTNPESAYSEENVFRFGIKFTYNILKD